jgi:type III restriction enzyme
MFELKKYQQRTLQVLGDFLADARQLPVADAFVTSQQREQMAEIPYRHYDFAEMPYVCLRLPTGGGKTVLASHAVGVAKRNFLGVDYPIVLWLVPTNIIRTQTLEALKTPGHPYRVELENEFGTDRLRVLDIGDVTQIRPQDIGRKAIVVVGTIATLRVEDTSGRKVYSYHEDFESHFVEVDKNDARLELVKEGDLQENGLGAEALGRIKYSFANILALHNPLVIMDEAHNARSHLSFEVIKRIHPACVIELTATPDDSKASASNVLYSVSAAELKVEQMIKLPIMLTEHTEGWQSAVRDAYLTREKLGVEAQKEPDYIRPIVLYQAEPKNGEVTVEVLKSFLMVELHIPDQEIAVATGNQRELDGWNLLSQGCPIKYIITIDALKEGWDCSFAYVFCSVREVRSNTAVEQLLGRVLRMPFAQRRQTEALNRAYAHLASTSFADIATKLTDRLVGMGFEAMEIPAYLQAGYSVPLFDTDGGVPATREEPPLELELLDTPDIYSVPAEDRQGLAVLAINDDGSCKVAISGAVTEQVEKLVLNGTKGNVKKTLQNHISNHNLRVAASLSPSMKGEVFQALPRLCIYEQGALELLESNSFLYLSGEWSLLDFPIELPNLSFNETTQTFAVDIEEDRVVHRIAQPRATYNLNQVDGNFTEQDLIRWLEREVRQPDITPSELRGWLVKLVSHLMVEKGHNLTALERGKFIFARAVLKRIDILRKEAASKGFQQLLFDAPEELETSFDYSYDFKPNYYPANNFYRGRYQFQKHYYPQIGDLKSEGEEFECAQVIDNHPQVKYWIRNLERREAASFSLPIAGRNFYPDFVAELLDGRLLVIEYKGEVYKTNDDSREKKLVGQCWADKGGDKCLFLLAAKDEAGMNVSQQIDAIVG